MITSCLGQSECQVELMIGRRAFKECHFHHFFTWPAASWVFQPVCRLISCHGCISLSKWHFSQHLPSHLSKIWVWVLQGELQKQLSIFIIIVIIIIIILMLTVITLWHCFQLIGSLPLQSKIQRRPVSKLNWTWGKFPTWHCQFIHIITQPTLQNIWSIFCMSHASLVQLEKKYQLRSCCYLLLC